jgi:hypothetical protein
MKFPTITTMKKKIAISLLCLFSLNAITANDSLTFHFFRQTEKELSAVEKMKSLKMDALYCELEKANETIAAQDADDSQCLSVLVKTMLRKDQLRDEIMMTEKLFEIQLSKIRYRKGIDFIKMIYEKTLGLDYHFTSLITLRNVSSLSNPNMFPEFQKTKKIIEERINKKQSLQLPGILESNPFVSLSYSLIASFIGGGDKTEREDELNQIACILDFTVSMNADLNIIYYETEFLKESNKALKEECAILFKEYTEVIGYDTPLNTCRNEDDWERLYELLNAYIENLEENIDNVSYKYTAYKQRVDLEFSIDRLLQFINKYNVFVAQGEKYYQKFKTMLNNYTNDSVCQSQLPHQFSELKADIESSVVKFNEAYNISELKGSKLKDLMYGLSEGH